MTDLTPLDRLKLPVFGVTTPLAQDLTTHLGKGADAASARVSALCEAVERYCAEPEHRRVSTRGSYRDLVHRGRRAADPADFELPDDSAYDARRPFSWVDAWDLLQGRPVLLPLDLAVNPPVEGVLPDVDTNGLAAGNSMLEAVVHGLCEVIERDCLSQHLFVASFGEAGAHERMERPVDVVTLPASARGLADRITACGLDLEISEMASDVDIPVFRCLLIDPGFPVNGQFRRRRFPGFGASPNAEISLLRAITEAVQSRIAVIHGARDSYNTIASPSRRKRLSGADAAGRPVPFDAIPSFESDFLADDLVHLLARLRAAGFASALAVDLRHPDIELAVVRVRVPGLSSFVVNRRRVGWRCLRHLL